MSNGDPNHTATTRRDFLAGSAATAGLAASGAITSRAHAGGSDAIRVAWVGCGGRGTGAVNQILNTKGNCKLIAAADAFRDKAEKGVDRITKRHKEKVEVPSDRILVGFDAYKHAMDTEADLVVLTTPPGFRPQQFEHAIAKNKHVFMEKPLATDAPGIRRLLAANEQAKQKNLAVAVGLHRRHENQYQETVKRVQDGAVGDVSLLRVYFNTGGVWVRSRRPHQNEMEYQMRNWYYFTWVCGDHIVEQHIHSLDIANWVKQAHPVTAQGQGGREVRTGPDHGQIFDHHLVEFTYEDGTKLFSQCRHIQGCWNHVAEYAHGPKGQADISGSRITGANAWKFDGQRQEGHQQEQHDLIDALMKGDRPNEVDYGAHSTMTAIMGRMATYSGKRLSWDEAFNSDKKLAPGIDDYTFESKPPVMPDGLGDYPVAVPGKTKVL